MRYNVGNTNRFWIHSDRGTLITSRRIPILKKASKVFTIGSCFAFEVRKALKASGMEVFPKWNEIEFDSTSQMIGRLPETEDVAHYDTFVILQEFRDALDPPELGEKDFVEISGDTPVGKKFGLPVVWQDPHRKLTYATSPEATKDICRKISTCIMEGLKQSDAYVITLGLVETWRNPVNGRFFCRPPGSGFNGGVGKHAAQFHHSTYEENLDNLRRIISLLQSNFPERPIILSVSPVILDITAQDQDIIVANTAAKSILRAVTEQVLQENRDKDVYYMPSYEIAQRVDIFAADGRHVTESAAKFIVSMFEHMFVEQEGISASQGENRRPAPG